MSMQEDAAPPVRFDSLGLNDRMRQRFELVFKGTTQEIALFVNTTVAEAVVVDLDNPGARQDWPRYRERFPNRPAILLSLSPIEAGDDVHLGKPIEISALMKAVARTRKRLEAVVEPPTSTTLESAIVPRPGANALDKTVVLEDDRDAPLDEPAEDPAWFRETVVLTEPPLARADEADRASPAAAAPAATPGFDPGAAIESPFDPSLSLLERVRAWRDGLADMGPAAMMSWNGLWFVYQPETQVVFCNLSRDDLQTVAELPCPAEEIVVGDAPVDLASELERDPDQAATRWAHPESLIWDLAIWTFAEQVPPGTELDERMYLSHWPNLSRLSLTPNALRISALWAVQPLSIRSLAEALKVPVAEVGTFYAACNSIGIAGPAKRNVDKIFRTHPVAAAPDRKLFGRLLGRLRGLLHTGQDGDGKHA